MYPESYTKLKNGTNFTLKTAKYTTCPGQQNIYNCLLFATANLIHHVKIVLVDADTYPQEEILELGHCLQKGFRNNIDTMINFREHSRTGDR
jgi:hypothetical protein